MKSLIHSIPFLLLFLAPCAFSSEQFNDNVTSQITYTHSYGDINLTGFTYFHRTDQDKSIVTESTKQQLQALTQQCMLTSVDVLLKSTHNDFDQYESNVQTCIYRHKTIAFNGDINHLTTEFVITNINYPRTYKDQLNEQTINTLTTQSRHQIEKNKQEIQSDFNNKIMSIKNGSVLKAIEFMSKMKIEEKTLQCINKKLRLLNYFEQITLFKKTEINPSTQSDPNPSGENYSLGSEVVPYRPLPGLKQRTTQK